MLFYEDKNDIRFDDENVFIGLGGDIILFVYVVLNTLFYYNHIKYFIFGYENLIDFENECVCFDDDLFNCDRFMSFNWFFIDFIEYLEFYVFI